MKINIQNWLKNRKNGEIAIILDGITEYAYWMFGAEEKYFTDLLEEDFTENEEDNNNRKQYFKRIIKKQGAEKVAETLFKDFINRF